MPIKLITLNIEGDKHFNRVFPFLVQQQADVVCIQEIFQDDVQLFTEKLGGEILFVPVTKMTHEFIQTHSPRGVWGIAIWYSAELALISQHSFYYRGDLISATQSKHPGFDASRAVQLISVRKQQEVFTIATTHFTWTPDGAADERQREDFAKLMKGLEDYPELVLCGDFNAPRGGEIFTAFCERFTDNLPADIESTVDPELHRLQDTVKVVVDTIFSTPEFRVANVEVVSGISDHKAVVGTVEHSPL